MTHPTIGGQNSNDDGQNNPRVSFTMRDANNETSTFAGFIFQPNATNLPDILADIGIFREAVQEVTLGVIAKEQADLTNTKLDQRTPTDGNAQRERKMQISAIDTREFLDSTQSVRNPNFQNTTKMEIPCARVVDPDGNPLLLEGTELYDPANPYIASLITAYETLFVSDAIGSLEVQDIRLVGRNI
jgi:hypothetical protein